MRTGRLKGSIGTEDTPDGCKVSAKVHYAGFVEFGTRYMVGRGFMSQAVNRAVDQLIRAFEETIR